MGSDDKYEKAPRSYAGEVFSSATVHIFQKIINNDEKKPNGKDFSLREAIAEAKRRIKAEGALVTGRPGKKLADSTALVSHLKSEGYDTTELEDKFSRTGPAVDAAMNGLEYVEDDFKGMAPKGAAASTVASKAVSTLTATTPKLVRTATAFASVGHDMEKAGGTAASAYKGSMFEHFARGNVLPGAKARVTILKQGTMAKDRSSDGYDPTTHTLWDMKFVAGIVPKDQADDYAEILNKGYKGTGGETITAVSYLFMEQAPAKLNKSFLTGLGIGVYYATGTGYLPA